MGFETKSSIILWDVKYIFSCLGGGLVEVVEDAVEELPVRRLLESGKRKCCYKEIFELS